MNIKSLITGLLLVLAAGGLVYVLAGGDGPVGDTGAAADETSDVDATAGLGADGLPTDGVVVYYFHGTKRCLTCNKMEALADGVIFERFGDHLQDGSVVFKPVNVETDATRHFIQDFQLASKVVVMVERKGGEQVSWRRLDEVWQKISEEDVYKQYIAENLAACLRELGLEQG